MTSDERRARRRERREARRAAKKAARQKGLTLEAVADGNALWRATKASASGVNWKASTQRYCKDWLRNAARARRTILEGGEVCRGFVHFDVCERGKVRHIASVHFSERVVHKSLCTNVLVPALYPTVVPSNTANQRGKGTHYAIALMKRQLARHWRLHGPEGYILQMDYVNYFGSIDHAALGDILSAGILDPGALALTRHLIDAQGSDGVGLGLGAEPNQISAVIFTNAIDHHVIETCGVEAFGRYMDDSYAIALDKDVLWGVLDEIRWMAADIGLEIHERKTRLVKLSHGFTFLNKHFSYEPSGRIVVRPARKTIVRERRKLKRLAAKHERGEIDMAAIVQQYQSWRGGLTHLDGHGAILRMDEHYKEHFGGMT